MQSERTRRLARSALLDTSHWVGDVTGAWDDSCAAQTVNSGWRHHLQQPLHTWRPAARCRPDTKCCGMAWHSLIPYNGLRLGLVRGDTSLGIIWDDGSSGMSASSLGIAGMDPSPLKISWQLLSRLCQMPLGRAFSKCGPSHCMKTFWCPFTLWRTMWTSAR